MRPLLKSGCRGVLIAAIVLPLALVAVGCTDVGGGGGGTSTSVAPPATAGPATTGASETTSTVAVATTGAPPAPTTTAGPPPSTVTTEALASSEKLLANGNITATCRIMGAVEHGVRSISVDYIDFLTGEAAKQAAIAAGDLAPGEELPNDYYINNVNPKIRDFEVSDSVAITTTSRGGGPDEPATWAEFMTWFGPSPPPGTEHLSGMPWLIERDAHTNLVVKIDEIYIP